MQIKRLNTAVTAIAVTLVSLLAATHSHAMSTIHILDLSKDPLTPSSPHNVFGADIHGDFKIDQVSSLSTIDLTDYDLLYVNEHTASNMFANRELDVRSALLTGDLGIVAEQTNNDALGSLSTILDTPVSQDTFSGPMSLTPAGTTHPVFTGTGIPGGAPVAAGDLDLAALGSQSTYSLFPVSAVVLAQDSSSNPVVLTGTAGSGRFFLLGLEPGENIGGQTPAESQFLYNVILATANNISGSTSGSGSGNGGSSGSGGSGSGNNSNLAVATPEPLTATMSVISLTGLCLAPLRRRTQA